MSITQAVLQIRNFQITILAVAYPLLRLLLMVVLPYTKNVEYHSFLTSHPDLVYDFIVVGSGSSGGVVAPRLAENDHWKVLLLESGGLPTPESTVPGVHILHYPSESDFHYKTTPQPFSMFAYTDNRNHFPRGRVLGGTSSVNFLMYVRGNRRDYDTWEAMGNSGWSYDDVLPYFKKSENYRGPLDASTEPYHSRGGYLSVEKKNFGTPAAYAFLDAGKELGLRSYSDPNAEFQDGFTMPDLTTENGVRESVAEAFIKPNLRRANFDVLIYAHVAKILFNEENRAIGVAYYHKKKLKVAYARREVILCAGAIDSPKLLMLSGVGPAAHLSSFAIPVIADVPGVGQNFHDQPVIFGIVYTVDKGKGWNFFTSLLNVSAYKEYTYGGTGPLSVPLGVEANAWHQISGGDPLYPDLQILLMSISPGTDFGFFVGDGIGIKRELVENFYSGLFFQDTLSMGPTLLRPKSRGSITLRSTDPFDQPNIDPNFIGDPEDLEFFVRACRFCLEIGETNAMKAIGAKLYNKPLPGCRHLPMTSDDYWRCYTRHLVSTIYHPGGSCKMAPDSDPMGVVNERLQVRGVKGLRVADASIMPFVVSGNTNAPCIMIGEKAADLIKEDNL